MEKRTPPKVPNDGPGPRGFPDCYYTSRVLDSTARYARFVKKLRFSEEEARKGALITKKELSDKQSNQFFIHCERRSLINNVAHRVELCMRSYEMDLEKKRQRLKELFLKEEEYNIRKFVEQAQAGMETIWREKAERLEYLLEKRRKEHEEKYKDTPLSKCAHVLPCIIKLRAKEAQEIQLYQMREKDSRALAEKEYDKMWNEVSMKECEALSARMEQDAIEVYRRNMECKEHSDMILEERKRMREQEKENLKREQLWLNAQYAEEERKEAEALAQKKAELFAAQQAAIHNLGEAASLVTKQKEAEKIIKQAWDSLASEGLDEEQKKADYRRRKAKDLNICNRKMAELRDEVNIAVDSSAFDAELKRQQDIVDNRRCEYIRKVRAQTKETQKVLAEQVKDNKLRQEKIKRELMEQNEYYKQVRKHQDELIANKERELAALAKKYQQNLRDQIEYKEMVRDREKQEEADQFQKGLDATKEYEDQIKSMLSRPYFSDEVHPFMKVMAQDLKMREKCPCAKADHCK